MTTLDNATSSVWQNSRTGLGTVSDRISSMNPLGFIPLNSEILSRLWLGDPFVQTIVSAIVDRAFMNGFFIDYKGDSVREKSLIPSVVNATKTLKLQSRSKESSTWCRLYGGSGILITTSEGSIEEKLDIGSVDKVYSLVVFNGKNLSPIHGPIDPYDESANSRFPEHIGYRPAWMSALQSDASIAIDPSRLAIFGGLLTSPDDRNRYFVGWDSSYVQPVYDALRRMHSDLQSVSNLVSDSSVGVMKIANLARLVSQGGGETLSKRMSLLDSVRSVMRTVILDAGDGKPNSVSEEYSRVSNTFAGIKDISEQNMVILASAARMPVTVLFGRSPGGENSTGEHDEKNWLAQVSSYRENELTEPIDHIVKVIASSMGADDLDNWGIKWNGIEVFTSEQKLKNEKTLAEIDKLRVEIGFDPIALILWRYGSGEYTIEPPTLTEKQQKLLEKAAEVMGLRPNTDNGGE